MCLLWKFVEWVQLLLSGDSLRQFRYLALKANLACVCLLAVRCWWRPIVSLCVYRVTRAIECYCEVCAHLTLTPLDGSVTVLAGILFDVLFIFRENIIAYHIWATNIGGQPGYPSWWWVVDACDRARKSVVLLFLRACLRDAIAHASFWTHTKA